MQTVLGIPAELVTSLAGPNRTVAALGRGRNRMLKLRRRDGGRMGNSGRPIYKRNGTQSPSPAKTHNNDLELVHKQFLTVKGPVNAVTEKDVGVGVWRSGGEAA